MGPPTMTGYRERVAVPHSDGLTGSERVGPKHRGGTAVEYFAGIDVSLEESSVCVVDGTGKIVREAKVASEPEALAAWFAESGLKFTRIGLEAGPLSQWLHAGLTAAGLAVILIETRHLKAALGADEGENRSQRRSRHRPVDADGLVSTGACEDIAGAGSSGAAHRTPIAPA